MHDSSNSLRTIFNDALEIDDPQKRAEYLARACGADVSLRKKIGDLIQAHTAAGGFLKSRADAANGIPATVIVPSLTEGPGTIIGRYKLLQLIGEGGFGAVYMAEQKEPVKRRVALKIIKLGMDTKQVVARFEAERQALALMDHPNIAKVFDAGATESGRPYFVMELVRGVPITQYCDENNLPAMERLKLFSQVCHAIQHAHQKGIIHRDIKPSNILVTLHDSVPVPKVIDFGIAKATQQELTEKTVFTQFQQFIGTPAYMSPEQAEMSGLDIDTRSDIYALGVLLYELLTGKTPFDAKELLAAGLDEMRRTIREREPARPSMRVSTMADAERATVAKNRHSEPPKLIHLLRGDLDWIVMKCLEKDRTRRYETANGLAQDVECHLSQRPVVARPASTAYRVQKFVRRNRVMVTAAGLVAAALVLGIVVSTWQAVRANRLRAKAVEAQEREAAQRQKAEQAQANEAEQRRLAVDARELAQRNLYVANMTVAQLAWDQNNIGRLRQVLEDTRESPYRGFEWYYWQPKTHLALMTLRGHFGLVFCVAFSPDGRRIVTGSWDQTAKVWEAASGRELRTLKGHRGRIQSVAFSANGQRIVTGSWDQTAKVWEAATGRLLVTLKGHNLAIKSVAFSPDGRLIVTGSGDRTAKVWDAASGSLLRTLEGHGNTVEPVAFSPDGQRILTGGGDARVWEVATGRQLLKLQEHIGGVAAAFSPDGQRIVTGGRDQTACVWEAATGRKLLTLKGHSGPINSVAYSWDGQRIVAGIDDNTARVWDAVDGRELLALKGHTSAVLSAAFSPDGRRIVTGSIDQTAKVWEASGDQFTHSTGGKVVTLNGHSNAIWSVGFSPDSQRIVTGSWDQTAKVWDTATGKQLLTLTGHSNAVWSVAFSPDGQRIVTGSADGTTKVWEAAAGNLLRMLKGHSAVVTSLAFSPDGQRIVTGSGDGTAKVWEAASGQELARLKGHGLWIFSVAFSPDGQRIVTGSDDRTAWVWEAASGRQLFVLKGHSDVVTSVAFSSDGQRIVTGSDDRTARVWEAVSGQEVLTLKAGGDYIKSVAFSPNGQRIIAGSWDGTAEVWEAARAEQVAAWQQEERAAAESLDALRRERTAEVERDTMVRARDSIKQWLLLAPIPLATGLGGAEGLDLEQIEGESRLSPKKGEARSVRGGELKWQEVALTNEVLDLNATLGQVTEESVAYAVCYLLSERAQRGLQMLVGSDDDAKVYLNGKEIYKSAVERDLVLEHDSVPDLALNMGLNVLVYKVVNRGGHWKGSIRFTDAEGNPVKGMKVTLNPEAGDRP